MKDVLDLNRDILSGRAVRRQYDLPQAPAPLRVREYLMATVDGRRCCLLRWFLSENIPIDSMTFTFIQLGTVGEELESSEVTYTRAELPAVKGGETFIPAWGIPVTSHCVSVQIRLLRVVSGSYTYHIGGDEPVVDYRADEQWVYAPRAISKEKLTDRIPLRIRSKTGGRVRLLWPVPFLAVICMGITISLPYLLRLIPVEEIRDILSALFA